MNLASMADGLFKAPANLPKGAEQVTPTLAAKSFHARLWSHPNNIVHVHVVPVQTNVPNPRSTGKPGHVQTKEIKERTILTEFYTC